jgi:hypothetical protein
LARFDVIDVIVPDNAEIYVVDRADPDPEALPATKQLAQRMEPPLIPGDPYHRHLATPLPVTATRP